MKTTNQTNQAARALADKIVVGVRANELMSKLDECQQAEALRRAAEIADRTLSKGFV